MFRHRPRTSRTLIGLLIVTLVLGAVSYWHNTSKSKAREMENETAPAAPSAGVATEKAPSLDAPLVTTTPPIAPSASRQTNVPAVPAARSAAAPATQPRPLGASSNAPPLTQAREKMQSGDLLQAREIANAALLSNRLGDADARAARALISEINQSVVFSPKRFADDPFGGTYSVQSGDRLSKIASKYDVTWELLCRLNGISDPSKLRAGAAIKVVNGPFHAVVDKSDFTMDMYLGEPPTAGMSDSSTTTMYITTFRVGLGADDSTPTGTWMVEPQTKLKNPTYHSPRGEGVIDADDPKNPLGERWIGLSGIDGHAVGKASYGIHGTIEPDSIGKMQSLGCIRLLNADVEIVYEMLVEGKSTVIVKE